MMWRSKVGRVAGNFIGEKAEALSRFDSRRKGMRDSDSHIARPSSLLTRYCILVWDESLFTYCFIWFT
jgi:hypothetical protein